MSNNDLTRNTRIPVLNIIGAIVLVFFGVSGLVYWLEKLIPAP